MEIPFEITEKLVQHRILVDMEVDALTILDKQRILENRMEQDRRCEEILIMTHTIEGKEVKIMIDLSRRKECGDI